MGVRLKTVLLVASNRLRTRRLEHRSAIVRELRGAVLQLHRPVSPRIRYLPLVREEMKDGGSVPACTPGSHSKITCLGRNGSRRNARRHGQSPPRARLWCVTREAAWDLDVLLHPPRTSDGDKMPGSMRLPREATREASIVEGRRSSGTSHCPLRQVPPTRSLPSASHRADPWVSRGCWK